MRKRMARTVLALVLLPAVLACCREAHGLIAGKNAETEAARLEKRGEFRDAAVWRLFAARAYREFIIPWEQESVRAYAQVGNEHLARTCARRAQQAYPLKVRVNLTAYEEDLRKAGGEPLRPQVEREVLKLLIKLAPLPTSVPSRLNSIEEMEKKERWHQAADYRELSARIYLFITVPFFERESDGEEEPKSYRRLQIESLKCLRLAQRDFEAAAREYGLAARARARKTDAESRRLRAFYLRKAREMEDRAKVVSLLVASKAAAQKSWPETAGAGNPAP